MRPKLTVGLRSTIETQSRRRRFLMTSLVWTFFTASKEDDSTRVPHGFRVEGKNLEESLTSEGPASEQCHHPLQIPDHRNINQPEDAITCPLRVAVGQELLLLSVICGERKLKEGCCCSVHKHNISMAGLLFSYQTRSVWRTQETWLDLWP